MPGQTKKPAAQIRKGYKISLSPEEHADWVALAEDNDLTLSEYLRQLVGPHAYLRLRPAGPVSAMKPRSRR